MFTLLFECKSLHRTPSLSAALALSVTRSFLSPLLPSAALPIQVCVQVVKTGGSGKLLCSTYERRDTEEYKLELGNAIINFVRVVSPFSCVHHYSYPMLLVSELFLRFLNSRSHYVV